MDFTPLEKTQLSETIEARTRLKTAIKTVQAEVTLSARHRQFWKLN